MNANIDQINAKLDELLESELVTENSTFGIEVKSYLKDARIIIKLAEYYAYDCLKLIGMAERMIDKEQARRQMFK